jgi:hypothetical protein
MRSQFARCLYNYTDAPVLAEVSITKEEGTEVVQTTVLKESNGWLALGAYGFTFSSPTLKVKLTQEKVVAPTPTPTPTPTASPVASPVATPTPLVVPVKSSITCVKGKLTKKVTGEKPKCPKGFKKR